MNFKLDQANKQFFIKFQKDTGDGRVFVGPWLHVIDKLGIKVTLFLLFTVTDKTNWFEMYEKFENQIERQY